MNVCILYQEMRTYGLREDLYRKARNLGIIFFRYNPNYGIDARQYKDIFKVNFFDTTLRRKIQITPELLILASAIVPPENNILAQQYKIAMNDDGFLWKLMLN